MKNLDKNTLNKLLFFVGLSVWLGFAVGTTADTLFNEDFTFKHPDYWSIYFQRLLTLFAGIVLAALIVSFLASMLKALDKKEFHRFFKIQMHRLNASLRGRNIQEVAPCIQGFLFSVLSKNTKIHRLDMGADVSCLSPYGIQTLFRNNWFYCFQLIVANEPEADLEHLKRLLNHLLFSELRNFGIVGLYSAYCFKNQLIPALYIDRLYYDASINALCFEVLFVGCDADASYLFAAVKRDAAPQNNIPEVYDDEI